MTLGKIYAITYLDHFSTMNKSPNQAVFSEDVILTTYGRCIGVNKNYYILSWNYCGDTSEDNDCMFILKKCVLKICELNEANSKK